MVVTGEPLRARHPYDAIRSGVVLVPADRLQALLPQRSVAENIAAPRFNNPRRWGPVECAAERRRVGVGDRGALDRHPRAAPGAAAVGRQPAEGDDRALARKRVPDASLLRPDARDRRRHEAADLRAAPPPCRRRRRDPALHERAGGDPTRLRPGRLSLRRTRHRGARRRWGGRGDAAAGNARASGGRREHDRRDYRPRRRIRWGRLARRHAWTVGVYVLLLGLDPLLADDPAAVGHVRRPVARDRRAAVRLRRDGAGGRDHLGRDRPLGRLDDGPRSTSSRRSTCSTPPRTGGLVPGVDRARGAARGRRRPGGSTDRPDHHRHQGGGHHRHARDALRLGRGGARGDADPRRRRAARVHASSRSATR